jgi:tetratricopeptide (TPR) repeat protein
MKPIASLILVLFFSAQAGAQSQASKSDFDLTLPYHSGQLHWRAEGYEIVQASAKPKGQEIGFRGVNDSNMRSFLTFLFLFPEKAPMTSASCRDGIMDPAKAEDPSLKILQSKQITNSSNQKIEVVSYSYNSGRRYTLRAFIAEADICGDMAFFSNAAMNPDDTDLKQILASFRFIPGYVAVFEDVFLYAQVLYRNNMFKDAGPIFERALEKLPASNETSTQTFRRIATDNAGMAYGISGNIDKARSIFESAIKSDPEYALNYYNLACADAEEGKLAEARTHLEQAFQRKANMLPGESLPDPTKDDSFLPHRSNKDFWTFLQSLR